MDGIGALKVKLSNSRFTGKSQQNDEGGKENTPVDSYDKGQDDAVVKPAVDKAQMTQALSGIGASLRTGEKIVCKVDDSGSATIEKVRSGKSPIETISAAVDGAVSGVRKSFNTIQDSDPGMTFALAVQGSALALQHVAPEAIKTIAMNTMLYPLVRGGQLLIDADKAMKTLKDPDSTIKDKIIDTAHVATDIAGVAGAVAPFVGIAVPGAPMLVGLALAADMISFGYHHMDSVKNPDINDPQPPPAPPPSPDPQPQPQPPAGQPDIGIPTPPTPATPSSPTSGDPPAAEPKPQQESPLAGGIITTRPRKPGA